MERLNFAREDGTYRVEAEMLLLGMDGCILIYGGDAPHIGAAAVGGGGMPPMETVFPGHREGEVVRDFREVIVGEGLLRHCVVCCGIHYDGISKDGIGSVLALCGQLLDEVRAELAKRRRPDGAA